MTISTIHIRPLRVIGICSILLFAGQAQTFGGSLSPTSIPDSSSGACAPGSPIIHVVTVPSGLPPVTSVRLRVGLTQTWYGDIVLSVEHAGITVLLMGPGPTCSGYGDASDLNGIYTFDDEASLSLDAAAVLVASNAVIAPGAYRGDEALSAFIGVDPVGSWTFTVRDQAMGDTGTIFRPVVALWGGIDFELQPGCAGPTFPAVCGAYGDPDDVSWNGVTNTAPFAVSQPLVATANGAGMPASGTKYLVNPCANPDALVIPIGGPIPPLHVSSDVYIPIPSGASTVSVAWDFYSAEGASAFPRNDAATLEQVAECHGTALITMAYVDTHSPSAPASNGSPCPLNSCGFTAREILPPGPQLINAFPIWHGAKYIRARAANSLDDACSSHLVLDDVTFSPGCSLSYSSPWGPGSLLIENTPCPVMASATYFVALTTNPGTYPLGWFFGLDISIPDIFAQLTFGPPFTGILDGSGSSSFGPITNLPPLTLYGVTTQFSAGYASFKGARPAVSYTIP